MVWYSCCIWSVKASNLFIIFAINYFPFNLFKGDGLLFEVFNSLMSRDDWKTVIKMPIGIIPGVSIRNKKINSNEKLKSLFPLILSLI